MIHSLNPVFMNAGKFISRGHKRHPTRVIDSFEMIYVLNGTLDMFENDREFHLIAGDRLFLFPGRKHGGLTAYEKNLSFFWMHLQFSPKEYAVLEGVEQWAPIAAPDLFRSYLQLLLNEQNRKRLENPETSQTNLNALASILMREALLESRNSNEAASLTNAANQYIKLHFDESLTTSEIAAHLKCHPDYLSRIYTRNCGITIGDAVRKERIRKALVMLEGSALPVKQIAFECGFNDVSYFRKQFFRECSMTPKEYRANHNNIHVNTE